MALLSRFQSALLALAGAAVVAFANARLQPAGAAISEPDFSRSRWIAERSQRARFSGGVLPTLAPLPVPQLAAPQPAAARAAGRVSKPRRVNRDLLPPGLDAQPETQAEPHLDVNPSDPSNLLAGYQESRFVDGGARALNYSVSFDRGQRWTEDFLPGLTVAAGGPWERASDPWVAFGPQDRAYFASLLFNQTNPSNAIGVSVSTDGGSSWSDPVEAYRSDTLEFNDKEALTVDTFSASPYYGSIYVAWDINLTRSPDQELVVARSTDGGVSYDRPVRVRKNGSNIGVIPRVAPEGTVYLAWGGGPVSAPVLDLYFSKSTDGGRRWKKPRVLEPILANGVAQLRAGSFLPSFAVDPQNGDLYLAWSDARWTGVDQATLMVSRDGGASWSAPTRVSDGPDRAPVFTVSVAAAAGAVAVSYYSLQNDPQLSFLADEYIALSDDGGASFAPSLRASRRSFDVRFAAQAGGYFLGDYAGLAASERRFHLLWVATDRPSTISPGQTQPDVFSARTR